MWNQALYTWYILIPNVELLHFTPVKVKAFTIQRKCIATSVLPYKLFWSDHLYVVTGLTTEHHELFRTLQVEVEVKIIKV